MRALKPVGMLLALAIALIGCAAPAGQRSATDAAAPDAPTTPKRVTLAFAGNPVGLSNRLAAGGSGGTGVSTLESLLSRGLSIQDSRGVRVPQLAEAVPTVENGLWKVGADGRMETTWKLRPNATWHDGMPFTTADLAFTARVDQDRDLPLAPDQGYRSVESIETPDAQSLTIKWKSPYLKADALFGGPALPKHLLEQPYTENKSGFMQLGYWGNEYMGTGPYKLRTWEPGSHVVLTANEAFALGRPQIGEIEVRFIPDLNTLLANILGGAVEMTLAGAQPSIDQAIQARDQWRDGRVVINVTGWIVGFPQLLTPNPAIVGDARFRAALLHGVDRQQLADGIQAGLAPVAHTNIGPNEPEFPDIERHIVRYEYDPRRATQMVEGLGLAKGPDGMYRDAQGQPVNLEVRSTGTYDAAVKGMVAVADFWQRLGFTIDQVPVPQQRQNDREYRANFGGFHVQRQPSDADSIIRYTSAEVPTAANDYRGESKNRYMSPQLDALVDRYFLTIPRQERMEVLGQVVRHMTENVVALGLFYDSAPRLISNRLVNVPTDNSHANVHEWDVR